ncbi:MAG: Ig-like domain-containing protein [Microbacteriaceae bacterium]
MDKRKIAMVGAGAVTALGLTLGGSVAANASSSNNAGILSTTKSTASSTSYTVTATRLTADADATIKLTSTTSESITKYYTTVDDDGRVSYTFTPTKAGVYTVKFYADGETTTKTIKVGTAYTKATVEANDTSDKKTVIEGTAVAGATLQVKVYDEDGDLKAIKTVTVDSDGDWTTTFKHATEDGTYTVKVRYVATSTHYSAKTYTTTFDRD